MTVYNKKKNHSTHYIFFFFFYDSFSNNNVDAKCWMSKKKKNKLKPLNNMLFTRRVWSSRLDYEYFFFFFIDFALAFFRAERLILNWSFDSSFENFKFFEHVTFYCVPRLGKLTKPFKQVKLSWKKILVKTLT